MAKKEDSEQNEKVIILKNSEYIRTYVHIIIMMRLHVEHLIHLTTC